MKNTIQKNNHPSSTRRDLLLLVFTCFISPLVQSEVTLDGSVGPAGALTGPDYKVTENLGKRAGSNLFHSFGRFNLNASESATFSGSTGIRNVISRVTGGQTSTIDGTLRVSIPNANLYLLNPAGVIFGEHATLDVPGSFHVSTADYLKFQDGVRFNSGVATASQVLATAAPEAFGFLGENPAGISLSGNINSELKVKKISDVSLIGGDITIENTALVAPGGQVNLVSVGSAGEVIVTEPGLDTTSFDKMGDIRLSHDPLGPLSINSNKVFVRGGQLTIDESVILTESGDVSGIDIGLTGNLFIRGIQDIQDLSSFIPGGLYAPTANEENAGKIVLKVAELKLVQGARITTDTFGSGNGGNLTIKANTISLSGNGTSILSEVHSQGDGGDLTINVEGKFEILDGAQVSSSNGGFGKSGNLTISANTILLSGNGDKKTAISSGVRGQGDGGDLNINVKDKFDILNGAHVNSNNDGTGDSGNMIINAGSILISAEEKPEFTGIFTSTFGTGSPSDLTINTTKSLNIINGGNIQTGTKGTTKGGNANINSELIILSGKKVNIFGAATSAATGNAGRLSLKASKSLEVNNGAKIVTDTNGDAQGGDLLIEAGNIKISDGEIRSLSRPKGRFLAGKDSTGNAGDLKLKVAGKVELSDNAVISTSTSGAGQGGDLVLTANDVFLDDARLEATSKSSGIDVSRTPNVGKAGNIDITPKSTLRLKNGSSINVGTEVANAGDITINKGRILQLSDSKINTPVHDGKGNGGNISINSPIVALDSSDIIARAAKGKGGNISISGFLFQSPSSIVDASSELGIDGNIDFKPDTNISGSIAVLPERFLNASQLLSERCVARLWNKLSSFVVKGRGGIPLSPGDLTPSNFLDYLPTEGNSPQGKQSLDYHSLDNNLSSSYSSPEKSYQFASMSIDCAP